MLQEQRVECAKREWPREGEVKNIRKGDFLEEPGGEVSKALVNELWTGSWFFPRGSA